MKKIKYLIGLLFLFLVVPTIKVNALEVKNEEIDEVVETSSFTGSSTFWNRYCIQCDIDSGVASGGSSGLGYGYGASLIGGFITFIATGFNDCYSLCDKLATNGFNAGNPNYKLPNYEYNSFDDVLNNDETLKKRLSNSGSTISELYKMLRDSIGTKSFDDFYNSDKKVLCIGRDIKSSNYESQDPRDMRQYQNYASKKGFRAFYNNNFMKDVVLAKKFDLFSLANDIVVLYCCKNNWDFVLVTNPYYYMEEHLDLSNGGASYANEIHLLRNNGYNRFANRYMTWGNIPIPKDKYYESFCYRVTRG